MTSQLEALRDEAMRLLEAAHDVRGVEAVRVRYLGKKGDVSAALKELGALPPDVRAQVGKLANTIKTELERAIDLRATVLGRAERAAELRKGAIDVTLPGHGTRVGARHPIAQVLHEIESVFVEMGFEIADGPEAELDYYNFEALNIPPDHPAREMQDTFYLGDDVLLRTHTSPVQIRYMEKHAPPLRIVCPGKVYRCDSDATHSPMFHQVEGLMIDTRITFSDLKGVLEAFLRRLFGPEQEVQLRPTYFPFVEPGADVYGRCFVCKGGGCRLCKGSGYIEILGAGMVHPELFRAVGYPDGKFTGFAFGLGVDRIAMLRYGITDIRLLYENDVRFLEQF
jgi:phenylalanyl-tRNA synthetase alpha chain